MLVHAEVALHFGTPAKVFASYIHIVRWNTGL
jgi:hypothetical protein